MTTEYTSYEEAQSALHTEMAKETQTVAIKTYQRNSDLAWVWAVTSTPTPVTPA